MKKRLFIGLLLCSFILVLTGCSTKTMVLPVKDIKLTTEKMDKSDQTSDIKEEIVFNITYTDGNTDKFYLFNYDLYLNEFEEEKESNQTSISFEAWISDNEVANSFVNLNVDSEKYNSLIQELKDLNNKVDWEEHFSDVYYE